MHTAPVHYGFKKITPDNWAKPGFPLGFHDVAAEDWVQSVLDPSLAQTVPEQIRALYEVARGACVYGWFFYPLMPLGAHQCFRVLEAAATEKRKKLGLPAPKNPSLKADIDSLIKAGAIRKSDAQRWDLIRQLRNISSHLSYQEIMMPAEVLRVLKRTEEAINRLFA